ncbi:MAG: DUF1559 domain-containing protein [Gemmataceae bacterium]
MSRITGDARPAFTLLELLTVISIIAVLVGLIMPAIQKVRGAAARTQCTNQVRQLALAAVHHHDEHGSLPMGVATNKKDSDFLYMSWLTRLLPYVEQDVLWQQALTSYRQRKNPFFPLAQPHPNLGVAVNLFSCPSDPRGAGPHTTLKNRVVGVTNYIGVLGTDHRKNEGVLYAGSATRFADITDGTSQTLMIGERPPAADLWYGWWYAGVGMEASGAPDSLLGVREVRTSGSTTRECDPGPYHFQTDQTEEKCAVYHFWSHHPGGANFAFCDGSVHFLTYAADSLLPALTTRDGNESVDVP